MFKVWAAGYRDNIQVFENRIFARRYARGRSMSNGALWLVWSVAGAEYVERWSLGKEV